MVHFCSSRKAASKFSKSPNFHMHISISEFVIPLSIGHQIGLPCIDVYRIYKCTILDYFPISQSNHYNIMMASICTDQCFIRPSAMLEVGRSCLHHISVIKTTSTNHIRTGLALQLILTKVIARAMAVFLAWAVVRTRPIARTTKLNNLDNSVYKHCLMTSLLICLPSLFLILSTSTAL